MCLACVTLHVDHTYRQGLVINLRLPVSWLHLQTAFGIIISGAKLSSALRSPRSRPPGLLFNIPVLQAAYEKLYGA